MWVQGSEFLYPDVFFLSDVSWVAMFQDGESIILVEPVGVGDVVDVVEVDAQGILVIEVVEVNITTPLASCFPYLMYFARCPLFLFAWC